MNRRAATNDLLVGLAGLGVGVLAWTLRATNLGPGHDIHFDEGFYARMGQAMREVQRPLFQGHPQYLHPPGLFGLEAIYMQFANPGLFQRLGGPLVQQVYELRYLNVLLAAQTATLLFFICWRITGLAGGLIAGIAFAFDPFAIRINTLILLETSVVFWVLLGVAMLIGPVRERRPLPPWRLLAATFSFGMALLMKDTALFITILPMSLCAITGWGISRPQARAMVAGLLLFELAPAAYATALGDGQVYLDTKLHGVQRFVGIHQESGFKAPGAMTNFQGALLLHLSQYASSYIVVGLGLLSSLYLLVFWRRHRNRLVKLLTVISGAAWALMGYLITLGTLDEQFLYFLIVFSLIPTTITAIWGLRCLDLGPHLNSWGIRDVAAAAIMLSVLRLSTSAWGQTSASNDDGYARLGAFADQQLPAGTRITTEPGDYLLPNVVKPALVIDEAQTLYMLQCQRPQYVILREVTGVRPPPQEYTGWVRSHSHVAFRFAGTTYGMTVLHDLDVDWRDPANRPQSPCPAGTPGA